VRLLTGLVICLAFSGGEPARAESSSLFRFWKPLDRGPSQDEEIIAFRLDSDIYDATRGGYPDLRVVDESDAELPYQLEPDVEFLEERSRRTFAAKVQSLRHEGNSLELRLSLPEKSPSAEAFTISTPQSNYERTVQVFGSNDGADWKPLVTDSLIFDYSRFIDISNREIVLPANNFREFRLVIGDVTDEKRSPYKELTRTFRKGQEVEFTERTTTELRDFRIDRIEVAHTSVQQKVRTRKTMSYPVANFESKEDPSRKQTILTVRTRREPISNFTLVTPSRNFHRRAVVEVPVVQGTKTEWLEVGSATLTHIGFRDLRREQLRIDIAERREEQYRIVIHNEDNPPLEISGVEVVGNVYRVVFLAQKSQTYRLFYGSESAPAPKYETAVVLAALRREDFQPVMATLGAETKNPGFGVEPGFALRKLLNNWLFLGSVICLMVVVLGWSLFRAGQHLKTIDRDESEAMPQ